MKVLLVEDCPVTRAAVGCLLRACEYDVSDAENGKQALDMIKNPENKFDLVLTDVLMPEGSGTDLLKNIHENGWHNIPVIIMSSEDSQDVVMKCLKMGASDYLIKPVRKQEMKNLWQHVWKKSVNLEIEEVRRRSEGATAAADGGAGGSGQSAADPRSDASDESGAAAKGRANTLPPLPHTGKMEGEDSTIGRVLEVSVSKAAICAGAAQQLQVQARVAPATPAPTASNIASACGALRRSASRSAFTAFAPSTAVAAFERRSQEAAGAQSAVASSVKPQTTPPAKASDAQELKHSVNPSLPPSEQAALHFYASLRAAIESAQAVVASVPTVTTEAGTCALLCAARGARREDALTRFREKRANRRFDKRVRYTSRQRLAVLRPRVKGQFVKQTPNLEQAVEAMA